MQSDADLKRAATDFADNIKRRMTQFAPLLPAGSNPELTHRFVELQVRNLIEEKLAPKRLLSGIFNVPGGSGAPPAASFVESAVQDPQRGRPNFEQGGFSVLNPATCVGVVQIKPSASNISKFQSRLREISQTYFFGRRSGTVMGVLVSDERPERKSVVHRNNRTFQAYDYMNAKWCPIFILFSRRSGQFEPHFPAIEALLANLKRLV